MTAQPSLTDLILETFRLNGELLTSGDNLVADLGLTSARWQVLGAIGLNVAAQPVAHIARNMGLSRQSVQRLVNDMVQQGQLRFAPNPHHQRAKLVLMTGKGKAAFEAAMSRQGPWAEVLANGIATKDIQTALRVVRLLRSKLQSQNDANPMEHDNVEEFA